MRRIAVQLAKMYMDRIRDDSPYDPEALLRDLVQHASIHVPYYKALFAQYGVVTGGTVHLERFQSLPLLEKSILRAQTDALTSDDARTRKAFWNSSGGSTGEPARFLQDRAYTLHTRVARYRQKEMAGYRFGEPMVKLWGDDRETLTGTRSWKSRLSNYSKNVTFLNSFYMSPDMMREYIRVINRIRPKLLVAYVHSLYDLCRFAEANGLEMRSAAAVMTSAGTLYPFIRETIERVCGAPVFNRYGGREVGAIASECERHNGLHIAEDGVYLEVTGEDGRPVPPGVEGEIILTTLRSRSMPLIRYRIGDRGVISANGCSCGRSGRMLAQVTGRISDVFQKRDGSVISSIFFLHLVGVVLNKGTIEKFQVVQKDYERVVVRIVAGAVPDEDLRSIESKVKIVMGPDCRVEFQFVDEIPPAKSGKFRYIINEMAERDTAPVPAPPVPDGSAVR